jgi:hypothetical protein
VHEVSGVCRGDREADALTEEPQARKEETTNMSLFDYQRSGQLTTESFLSLVMAALRRADSDNYRRLATAFPEVEAELRIRYNAPGGVTPAEAAFEAFEGKS